MKTNEQADVLARLRYMDEQQARLVDAAMPKVRGDAVSQELGKIRDDHRRHIGQIDELFGGCGEDVVPRVPEAEQRLAEDRLSQLQATSDERAVLELVLDSEQQCEAAYARADAARLPAEEGPAMAAHYAEEKRHVDVLEARV